MITNTEIIEREVLGRIKPTWNIASVRTSARSNIEWYNVLSELIDNAILLDSKKCVTVNLDIHWDKVNDKSYIECRDDSIGIPEKDILNVFNYGVSANIGKMLLCKMGMGLKGAIWGLGEFEYLISKAPNGKPNQIEPIKYDSDESELEYLHMTSQPSILDEQYSGTIVRIKGGHQSVPNWKDPVHFQLFVSRFNNMYAQLLYDERVKINITYTNSSNGIRWYKECSGSFPLMSNHRNIMNIPTNLGHNEPEYESDTKTPIKDIIVKTKNTKVKVTAWHKPTPHQVETHFLETGDPDYDPIAYKNSLFGYGSEKSGIIVMYKGKFIEFGLDKKSSRNQNQGIILEIDDQSGLSFTSYKNTLQRNNNYNEMIDAVDTYLKDHGFFIRSTVGSSSVAEDEIVTEFIKYLKSDIVYLENFNIKDANTQIRREVRTGVGGSDIIIVDYENPDIVTCVIEAKKDRAGGQEAAQLWSYMAYHNCKKGYLLSGIEPQPTFFKMVDRLKKFTNLSDVEISEMNIKTLKSTRFFTN